MGEDGSFSKPTPDARTTSHPVTPDGRYFVVRGRLWRMSNPSLATEYRAALVKELMKARRKVGVARRSGDPEAETAAHDVIDRVKRELGERGAVWWTDGSPDYNRHMARTTPYGKWFANQSQ